MFSNFKTRFMKPYLFLFLTMWVFSSCDLEATKNCFQSKGDTIKRSYDVMDMQKITIRENIRLEITYGKENRLEAEGRKSHLDQLTIVQDGEDYEFSADGLCKTGFTEAPIVLKLVTSKLNYIRNSSQFNVVSTSTLNLKSLTLIAEDFNDTEALNLGGFQLSVESERINITGTGLSNFEVSGITEVFNFGTYSGSGSILARHLDAKVVTFHHRSFSDAVVNPSESLTGKILSTGNLICIKKPPLVEVEEFYTGKLIFE